jgi:hypothetical protein
MSAITTQILAGLVLVLILLCLVKWRHGLANWVRYLYFLRFSLALWLFAPLLCLVNMKDQTLTSGILVPEFFHGYLCVGFFLVSCSFAALISARVTLINGLKQWDNCTPPSETRQPHGLECLLVNEAGRWEQLAVLVSLLPNILAGGYLVHYGISQYVSEMDIIAGLLFGSSWAVFLWGAINVLYYLVYDAPEKPWERVRLAGSGQQAKVQLGVNAARTILFPRRWLRLKAPNSNFARDNVEGAETILNRPAIARLSGRLRAMTSALRSEKEDGSPTGNTPDESFVFAVRTWISFLGLSLIIWPLTAPVPSLYASITALALLLVVATIVSVIVWSAKPADGLLKWKILLTVVICIFLGIILWLYLCSSAERFPIFATLLMMTITICWTLAGIALFVDRYRVPVLTAIIVLMVLPRMFGWVGDREEHYFSTNSIKQSNADLPPTPAEILKSRIIALGADRPLIIVTATGGGLHASAWTAAVMARLETEFAQSDVPGHTEPFHKHLLLASTVSGGSVGLDAYLHDLYYQKLKVMQPPPGTVDMQAAARCSSLEAVGWGLVYYDFPKAVVPGLPYLLPLSSGNGDLDSRTTPLFHDRTWSLRKSFERNLTNTYCGELWERDKKNAPADDASPDRTTQLRGGVQDFFEKPKIALTFRLRENLQHERDSENSNHELTLRSFPAVSSQRPDSGGYPAFTMNSTSVEVGARFLLANYRVPHYTLDDTGTYPAQSFLDSFAGCGAIAADLPLATAAQLSATFPYVSSASRAPRSVDCNSVHFVDGGYYDNDGTASALEFLRYALASPNRLIHYVDEDAQKRNIGNLQKALQTCDPKAIPPRDDAVREFCAEFTSLKAELFHLNFVNNSIQQLGHPLHILWIEIRNSGDYDGGSAQASGGNGATTDNSNLLGQTWAAPETFWNAGHESMTGRNRVALGLMEQALSCKVQIHRIILADTNSWDATDTDPLNWSLTPRQRVEVTSSADKVKPSYEEAKKWFYSPREEWDKAQTVNDPSCVIQLQADTIRRKR